MFFPPYPQPHIQSGVWKKGGEWIILNLHTYFPIPLQLKGKGPAPAVSVRDRAFVARGLGGGPV